MRPRGEMSPCRSILGFGVIQRVSCTCPQHGPLHQGPLVRLLFPPCIFIFIYVYLDVHACVYIYIYTQRAFYALPCQFWGDIVDNINPA